MQLSVTFRHMDATDALKSHAKERVDRIKKYFPDPIMAHVVLSTERGYQHVADVNIQLHNGLLIKGREITEDMYSSIDLVMDKIERQVVRYKEKLHNHKSKEDLSSLPISYRVIAEAGADRPEQETQRFHVVKQSKFAAKALSTQDAVMQMNMMHNNFLVFRNQETGQVNVVYKRDDGTYGLIEPDSPTAS